MKEQLISFETSKLAKEKKFNEPVLYHYLDNEGDGTFMLKANESYFSTKIKMVRGTIDIGETSNIVTTENLYDVFNEEIEYYISAPTQSLLAKWLREKHGIDISILILGISDYQVYVHKKRELKYNGIVNFVFDNKDNIYEEAYEIGLQEALKLIKY